jgi:hypothetical protein
MTEQVTYYAIYQDDLSASEALGLARRTFTSNGRLDEAIRGDLSWGRDSVIYEWERGEELGTTLVEISAEEAEALVERFREKWGEQG